MIINPMQLARKIKFASKFQNCFTSMRTRYTMKEVTQNVITQREVPGIVMVESSKGKRISSPGSRKSNPRNRPQMKKENEERLISQNSSLTGSERIFFVKALSVLIPAGLGEQGEIPTNVSYYYLKCRKNINPIELFL